MSEQQDGGEEADRGTDLAQRAQRRTSGLDAECDEQTGCRHGDERLAQSAWPRDRERERGDEKNDGDDVGERARHRTTL